MKRWMILLLVFPLAACSLSAPARTQKPTEKKSRSFLSDKGEAPEITNDVWLNTAAPLRLADLRGKVVLLDMWTFG